jgi:hypothetical protein
MADPGRPPPLHANRPSPAPGEGLTLQINLCAGDAGYAPLTVPALVRAHPEAGHRLAIVDCCRQQHTRIFDPETRAPLASFQERLGRVRTLAEKFRREGLFDEVAYLEPGDPRFRDFAGKYARPWMTETHDYGGCANMAYWASLELPRTRYLLHYDADLLLHQDPGCSWVGEALALLPTQPQAIFALPRISPPGWAATPAEDGPSCHEGRPPTPVAGGWLNDWFSTRCFLLDRERLEPRLPLVRGPKILEYRLRRLLDRGYPPGPEHLLFRELGGRGWRTLNLSDPHAWLLHPTRKDAEYYRLLPGIMAAVAVGRVPAGQRGHADLRLEDWAEFLVTDSLPSP